METSRPSIGRPYRSDAIQSKLTACSLTFTSRSHEILYHARFPSFRCRSSVAVSLLPLAVAVAYLFAYLFAVYGCNGTEFSYGIFYRTTEFYNGRTAKRQRKNGNGMVETWHNTLPRYQSIFYYAKKGSTNATNNMQKTIQKLHKNYIKLYRQKKVLFTHQ